MKARDFALISLDQKRLPGWRRELPGRIKYSSPKDYRDVALAEQIVAGVIKNWLRLQYEIEYYSGKRSRAIDPLVQRILAIALYQLEFLDRVPASAAVNEAVEQTRHFGRRSAAGFVNAVLRNVGRMAEPQFPDEKSEPEQYAEVALSHPRELFKHLAELLGQDRAIQFCRHDNAEPPVIVRLAVGKTLDDLQADLEKHCRNGDERGAELSSHQRAGFVVVRNARKSTLARWAKEGLGQVQDPTAAAVVPHMQLASGQRVLDRCAGRGTKTLQIREIVGDMGEIVAVDPNRARNAALRHLVGEKQMQNITIVQTSMMHPEMSTQKPWERILIDVPCSNSGVLARRPEARYATDTGKLVQLQQAILRDTLSLAAPGGLVMYSTCSVWPQENEEQVRWVLRENPEMELLEENMSWPSFETNDATRYHDGGYWALLRHGGAAARGG